MANDGGGFPIILVTNQFPKPGPVCDLCGKLADTNTSWVEQSPHHRPIGLICAAAIATAIGR